jgi:tetratricopeptide (TPR) repeat protein
MTLESTISFTNDSQFLMKALELLTPEQRELLKRLSIFQAGALEYDLLAITDLDDSAWKDLRAALESMGLIQVHSLNDLGIAFPYLRFHSGLAELWKQLNTEQRLALAARYRQRYYELANWLYQEDSKNSTAIRAIAQLELPNLLAAAYAALQAAETFALEFVDNVSHFLDCFDLPADKEALAVAIQEMPAPSSRDGYSTHADQAQQLFDAELYEPAASIYQQLLQELPPTPSHELCVTLDSLARCSAAQGKINDAINHYQQALQIAQQLTPSTELQQQISVLHSHLADTLTKCGDFATAKTHYQQALAIDEKTDDTRGMATVQLQLGTLAMLQSELSDAEQYYKTALAIFQSLNEMPSVAVVWNQLGQVYQQTSAWKKAENAYRQAAKIEEELGNTDSLAETWHQLAIVNVAQGKLNVAEGWYRKTINSLKSTQSKELAAGLYNFATLLQNQAHRLEEARQVAEEALTIHQTLVVANTGIWTVYHLLADIADQQQDRQAAHYRQLARESYLAFEGMIDEMQQNAWLIAEVTHAVLEQQVNEELSEGLQILAERQGLESLVTAIQDILNGERDIAVLMEPLDFMEAATIHLILQGIDNPESLDVLFD